MKKAIFSVIFVIFVSISPAMATEAWDPVSAGPVTTWTAPVCGKGEFVVQPYFLFNLTRGTFDAEGRYDALPGADKQHQYVEQLFMQYGLTDMLELDVQIAYQQNIADVSGARARSGGFADSYVFLRGCLLEETKILPQVTALAQVKMPTGKYQKADPAKLGTDLMGTGSYDYGAGVTLSKKIKPFILHADAVYSFPVATKIDGVKTEYDDYFNFDMGAEYFFGKGFNLMIEANVFLQGDNRENGILLPATDTKSLTASFGAGWSNDVVQTLLAYQRVVAGTNTDANDSVIFTFVYSF